MKTSTIMIITAVLITLGCLTAFNFKVKEVYLTGAYKSRFRDMEFTPLKGVEKLDIEGANRHGIQVEQGDKEGIWIRNNIKDRFVVTVDQQTLKLSLSKLGKEFGFRSWGSVIIITKKLNSVVTGSYLSPKNEADNAGEVNISGYQGDHLDLQISHGVNIYLGKLQLNTLTANVGDKEQGNAGLTIGSETKINAAQLNVPGSSNLDLQDPKIVKVSYNLSDSATVSLSGKVVRMIK